jgi:hypothetical protein
MPSDDSRAKPERNRHDGHHHGKPTDCPHSRGATVSGAPHSRIKPHGMDTYRLTPARTGPSNTATSPTTSAKPAHQAARRRRTKSTHRSTSPIHDASSTTRHSWAHSTGHSPATHQTQLIHERRTAAPALPAAPTRTNEATRVHLADHERIHRDSPPRGRPTSPHPPTQPPGLVQRKPGVESPVPGRRINRLVRGPRMPARVGGRRAVGRSTGSH